MFVVGRSIRIKNVRMQLAKWFSAWIDNPYTMMVGVRIQHGAKKKDSRTTPGYGLLLPPPPPPPSLDCQKLKPKHFLQRMVSSLKSLCYLASRWVSTYLATMSPINSRIERQIIVPLRL